MAKVRIQFNTRGASRAAKRRVNEAIARAEVVQEAAERLKEEIRKGINPQTGKKYRRLEKSTIESRRRLSQSNNTHPDFRLRKSNLTLTGALIDALKSRFSKSSSILTIFISGEHPGYKGKSGKQIKGSRKANAKIAGALAEQGRPILGISKKFAQEITRSIERALRRL